MTRSVALAFLGVLALLPACGDGPGGPGGGLRFQLEACSVDGEPPSKGLTVQRLTREGTGPVLAAMPVPDAARTFVVPGASEGPYLLTLPDGWWHLMVSGRPPLLRAGPRPARFRIGRAHTIYLASHEPRRLLGDAWGMQRRILDGGGTVPIELTVTQDPAGITVLRIRPEDWQGNVELQGRYVDGGLTEIWKGDLRSPGRPIYFEPSSEPLAPLRVVVAGAPPDADVEVSVRGEGLPLPDTQRARLQQGVAKFPGGSINVRALEVSVGEPGPLSTVRLGEADWRAAGEVRVLWPPPAASAVEVPLGASVKAVRVQVRPEGADGYGLVPIHGSGDAAHVRLAPGRYGVLVEDGQGAVVRRLEVAPPAPPVWQEPAGALAPAHVHGVIEGRPALRVRWQRVEDGVPVLAQGFVMQTDGGGRYAGRLPPGDYRVEVEDPAGRRSPARTIALASGARLSLPLDPPAGGR